MKKQKGFANILLILVGVLFVGGAVYFYKNNDFSEVKTEAVNASAELALNQLAGTAIPTIKSSGRMLDESMSEDEIKAYVDEWIKDNGGTYEDNLKLTEDIINDKSAKVSDCYKISKVQYDMQKACIIAKSTDKNIKKNCSAFAKSMQEDRTPEDKKTIAAFEFGCVSDYYTNKSIATNNTKQCNSIKKLKNIWNKDAPHIIEEEYNLCVYYVNLQQAVLKKDISYCNTLESVVKGEGWYGDFPMNIIAKENCYYYVGRGNNDDSICKNIQHENLQKTCLAEI